MVNANYLLALVTNTVIVPVLSVSISISISATADPVANLAFAFPKLEQHSQRTCVPGRMSLMSLIAPGSDSCQSQLTPGTAWTQADTSRKPSSDTVRSHAQSCIPASLHDVPVTYDHDNGACGDIGDIADAYHPSPCCWRLQYTTGLFVATGLMIRPNQCANGRADRMGKSKIPPSSKLSHSC